MWSSPTVIEVKVQGTSEPGAARQCHAEACALVEVLERALAADCHAHTVPVELRQYRSAIVSNEIGVSVTYWLNRSAECSAPSRERSPL